MSDSAPGNGPTSGQLTEPNHAPAPGAPPSPAAPAPEPPKTAATVIKGAVTEDTIKLRAELDEKDRLLKQRETEVSEWQREHQKLKASIETPTPVPVKKETKKPFRIGRFL